MTRATLVMILFLLAMGGWTGYRLKNQKERNMTQKEQIEQLQKQVKGLEQRNKNLAEQGMLKDNQINQLKKHVASFDTLLNIERDKNKKLGREMTLLHNQQILHIQEISQRLDSMALWNYQRMNNNDGQGGKSPGIEAGQIREQN